MVNFIESFFGTSGRCDGNAGGGVFQGTFNLTFYMLKSKNYNLEQIVTWVERSPAGLSALFTVVV